MRNKHLLIIFLLALSLSGFAQQTFSTDKTAFLEEMTAYLGSSSSKTDRDEAAAMMTGFADVWNEYYSSTDAKRLPKSAKLYTNAVVKRLIPTFSLLWTCCIICRFQVCRTPM